MPKRSEIIKMVRKEKEMKQKDVAAKLGIKQEELYRYENGRQKISIELIEKLANIYEVSPEYLAGWKDEEIEKDKELNEILQECKDNKGMRILFSTSKDASPKDIKRAVCILESLKQATKEEEKDLW